MSHIEYHKGPLAARQKRVRIGQELRRAAARIDRLESRLATIRELERLIRECDTAGIQAAQRTLEWYWSIHPCGTCGSFRACRHREPEVDAARLTGMVLALEGKAA